MRPALVLLTALASALSVAVLGYRSARAQDPLPFAFMHNVTPNGTQEPSDGASVLVVEGLGLGLGSPLCASYDSLSLTDNLNIVVYYTDISIKAGRPTVLEISPQSSCDSNMQDWKNVILELATRIETDTGGAAASWWGGIMLDEEPAFWTSSPSAAAYEDLNHSVQVLMSNYRGSWYYTESFAFGAAGWSQSEFDAVTGASYPAPQIATPGMVSIVNAYQAAYGASILVTWGLGRDYGYHSLIREALVGGSLTPVDGPAFLVNGSPFSQWGMNLSNCFIGTVCNDWDGDGALNASDNCYTVYNPAQTNTDGNNAALGRAGYDSLGDACDDNISGDGYTNGQHTALGGSPFSYCNTMRADVNGDGKINLLDLSLVAGSYGLHFAHNDSPPGGVDTGRQRLDQNGDNVINVLDLSAVGAYYNHVVTACP